jgi:hypothetical protein
MIPPEIWFITLTVAAKIARKQRPAQPFYLIVTDHDRRVFAVEGPMTDDQPWIKAVVSCPPISGTASLATRAALIAMRWQQNFGACPVLPVCRPAAL